MILYLKAKLDQCKTNISPTIPSDVRDNLVSEWGQKRCHPALPSGLLVSHLMSDVSSTLMSVRPTMFLRFPTGSRAPFLSCQPTQSSVRTDFIEFLLVLLFFPLNLGLFGGNSYHTSPPPAPPPLLGPLKCFSAPRHQILA